MTWTCSECRNQFQPSDTKHKFNLCRTCYFNPSIAKAYRSGEKQPLPDTDPVFALGADSYNASGVSPIVQTQADPDPSMYASAPMVDDVIFQNNVWDALVRDTSTTGKVALQQACKKLPPGRKPDIAVIAKDIFELKKMLLSFLKANGIELPPAILDDKAPTPQRQASGETHLLSDAAMADIRSWDVPNPSPEQKAAVLDGLFKTLSVKNPPQSNMPTLEQQALNAVKDFNHPIGRSDMGMRRIMPPVQIGEGKLDRSVDTDIPVRMMDQVEKWEDQSPDMRFIVRHAAQATKLTNLTLSRPGDDLIAAGNRANILSLMSEVWPDVNELAYFVTRCKHPVVSEIMGKIKLMHMAHDGKLWVALCPKFDRWLTCFECHQSWPFERVWDDKSFCAQWRYVEGDKQFRYVGYCPDCRPPWTRPQLAEIATDSPPFMRVDRSDWSNYILRTFKASDVETAHTPGGQRQIWKVPDIIKAAVNSANEATLRDMPWEMIMATTSATGHLMFDGGIVHQTDTILSAIHEQRQKDQEYWSAFMQDNRKKDAAFSSGQRPLSTGGFIPSVKREKPTV